VTRGNGVVNTSNRVRSVSIAVTAALAALSVLGALHAKYVSAQIAHEFEPFVKRLERMNERDSLMADITLADHVKITALGHAIRQAPGTPERARAVARLDSIDNDYEVRRASRILGR